MQPRICYRFWSERIGGGDDDAIQTSPVHATRRGGRGGLKKQVELDRRRQPFGAMKEVLFRNIKKYAKDLDPTTRWEGRLRSDRKRLLQRLRGWVSFVISNLTCERTYTCRAGHAHMWLDVYPRCIRTSEATWRCLG